MTAAPAQPAAIGNPIFGRIIRQPAAHQKATDHCRPGKSRQDKCYAANISDLFATANVHACLQAKMPSREDLCASWPTRR